MSRWYRTHVGLVTDAKLGEAALIAETSRALVIAAWHAILESCADTNDAGRFDTTPRRVAAILAEPVARIEAVFAAFVTLGMIEAGRVVAWTRRQFESDSSTDRVRKHRDAKRNGELSRGNVVETPSNVIDAEINVSTCPVKRFETPPYTDTYTDTHSLSPSVEASARELPIEKGDFDRFWKAMPSPNPSARAAAEAAFAKLDPVDRARAIAGAGRYAAAFAAKPTTHPMSPVRFLRERGFEGYGAASTASEGMTVLVRVDSPQWRAWAAYRGKTPQTNRKGTGWRFASERPPGVEGERGAA